MTSLAFTRVPYRRLTASVKPLDSCGGQTPTRRLATAAVPGLGRSSCSRNGHNSRNLPEHRDPEAAKDVHDLDGLLSGADVVWQRHARMISRVTCQLANDPHVIERETITTVVDDGVAAAVARPA